MTPVDTDHLARVVPYDIDISAPPTDAMDMYRAWVSSYLDETRVEDAWMPIGRVGPVLVLGHHSPETAPTPAYPLSLFGLARIPKETHQRLAERVAADFDGAGEPESAPLGAAESLADSSSVRDVVDLLRTFPGASRESDSIEGVLQMEIGDEELLDKLPAGWAEAAVALYGGHPLLDLTVFEPSQNVLALVPDAFAREHELVPLGSDSSRVYVATSFLPASTAGRHIVQAWKVVRSPSLERHSLVLVMCPPQSRQHVARRAADRASKQTGPTFSRGIGRSPVAGVAAKADVVVISRNYEGMKIESTNVSDADMLNLALLRAVMVGASDLHIGQLGGNGWARVRVHGRLGPLDSGRFAGSKLPAIVNLLRNRCGIVNKGSLDPVDGSFSLRVDDKFFKVRVSVLASPNAASDGRGVAVLRILPKDAEARNIADLHLDKEVLDVMFETLEKPSGLVLVTGPTGSGKTTTINSMLTHLVRGGRNGDHGALKIVTIEDPIEYDIDGVDQNQVTQQFTMARAVDFFVRQDPDVIFVGEIRDAETGNAAVKAGLTGHLVVSTLHTNSAAETIKRLRNLGIPPYDLDGTLLTLFAQRLVPHLCPNCKRAITPTASDVAAFKAASIEVPTRIFARNHTGCGGCRGGIHGVLPVIEAVKVLRPIRDAMLRGDSESQIADICDELGFPSIEKRALRLAAQGVVSVAEAASLRHGWD